MDRPERGARQETGSLRHSHTGGHRSPYGVSQSTGKIPVKGSVPKNSAYFEPEDSGDDEGGFTKGELLYALTDLRIILGVIAVILLVVTIFFAAQNSGLRRDIAEGGSGGAYADARDEVTRLQLMLDNSQAEVNDLRAELSLYQQHVVIPYYHGQGNEPGGDNLVHGGVSGENPLPTPPPARYVEHTVRQGETLSQISTQHYGTSRYWRDIVEFNNLPNEHVRPGQVLRIPPR
jgi:LysM repeat protein